MHRDRGLTLLWSFGVAAILGSSLGCSKGGNYIGRWECASGGGDFFEIKANNGAFLVTDEDSATYPASLDDKGTLVISGVPLVGTLPLPIDSSSGELICSACSCNRYAKKSDTKSAKEPDAGQVEPKQSSIDDKQAEKKTVADIRNTGTAMFSWLTDHVGAGGAGQSQTSEASKVVALEQYPPISRQELGKILVPQYMQSIPETDGWGHPYEFYLNTENPLAKQVMGIRSPGRDGKFSATAYTVGPFAPDNFDEDIVWSDGFFVRWPQAK